MIKASYGFRCEDSARFYATQWLDCYRDGYCGTVLVFQAVDGLWIVETARLASCD